MTLDSKFLEKLYETQFFEIMTGTQNSRQKKLDLAWGGGERMDLTVASAGCCISSIAVTLSLRYSPFFHSDFDGVREGTFANGEEEGRCSSLVF